MGKPPSFIYLFKIVLKLFSSCIRAKKVLSRHQIFKHHIKKTIQEVDCYTACCDHVAQQFVNKISFMLAWTLQE